MRVLQGHTAVTMYSAVQLALFSTQKLVETMLSLHTATKWSCCISVKLATKIKIDSENSPPYIPWGATIYTVIFKSTHGERFGNSLRNPQQGLQLAAVLSSHWKQWLQLCWHIIVSWELHAITKRAHNIQSCVSRKSDNPNHLFTQILSWMLFAGKKLVKVIY